MGIYGNNTEFLKNINTDESGEGYEAALESAGLKNPDELLEAYFIDYISKLPNNQIKEICEGEVGDTLVEAGILRRKTLVRLSKDDDFERRTAMAAMQIARDKKDPLWDQLARNRVKEKDLLSKIKNKYGNAAEKAAKAGQKEFLKRKLHLPKSFQKAGGEERVGI